MDSFRTNSQTYTVSKGQEAAAIDQTPFARESLLSFSYDQTTETQSISFQGFLTDWKKNQLENLIPTNVLLNSLLDAVQASAQTAR